MIVKVEDCPLVMVEWDDAESTSDWMGADTFKAERLACRSVGWLLEDLDRYVVVAGTVAYQAGSDDVRCVMTIPRGCIRTMRRL